MSGYDDRDSGSDDEPFNPEVEVDEDDVPTNNAPVRRPAVADDDEDDTQGGNNDDDDEEGGEENEDDDDEDDQDEDDEDDVVVRCTWIAMNESTY